MLELLARLTGQPDEGRKVLLHAVMDVPLDATAFLLLGVHDSRSRGSQQGGLMLELLLQAHVAHRHAGLTGERFEDGRIRRGEMSRQFGAALDETDPLAVDLDRHGQHRLLVGVRRLALTHSWQEPDANPAKAHAVLQRRAHPRQQSVEVIRAGQRLAETHDQMGGVGLRPEHPAVGEPFEPGA